MRDVGRGSPVGVEFYTSYAYPREFFDNYFEADWSRGRLLYTALTPAGATYSTRSDRAEFVHGEPFNITDVEVGPDGMMYFTTGGRNTTGGVWRLRYTGTDVKTPDMSGILAVVRQPQPLSSWGWAAIEKVKASMGASFGVELERVARNAAGPPMDRVRALYEMQRHGAAPSAELLAALSKDKDASVRSTVVYLAGVQGGLAQSQSRSQGAIAAAGLKDASPVVRRRAAEALVRMGQSPDKPSLAPVADIYALLNDQDRFVRWAGRVALERTARSEWKDRALKETNILGAPEAMIALVNTASGESLQKLIDKQFAMMKQANLSAENKLRLFRAFQYTTTEIKEGLNPGQREQLHGLIVSQFPASDERLNRELALMLAYAGQPQGIAKILAAMPKGDENQQLQLHYLYALRTVNQGWTPEQKVQLAELLGRASNWRGGAQFVNFVGQMFDAVQPLFATPEEQQLLYEKAPDFSPLTPEQLAEIQARQKQLGRGGGGGGRGTPANPLAARRAGRVISRQEMLEETVFQPQQNLDAQAGREVFEKNCASCHRFGTLGTDHGVAGLDLTNSKLRASKFSLLEAVMIPNRAVAPAHETTVIAKTDGTTVRGLLVREDAQAVSLLGPEGTVADVPKAQIKARTKEKISIMSEEMADTIPRDQLRNLAEFLTASPGGSGK
jgi:putative heme-binding domain-containing protein